MDDIIFWESGETFKKAHTKLKYHATNVERWLERRQMRLNSSKTKFLSNKEPPKIWPIIIQNCHYYPVRTLRYLGVQLYSHPDGPDIGIDLSEVRRDLKRRCSLISRASKWLPTKICKLFAKSIIIGKLNYYLPFLGAECDESLDPLVKGLNSAMRFITGAFITTPIPLLHSRSGIPPIRMLIDKAAGNMWTSLQFHPNGLTDDYEEWAAVGDNGRTPLGSLWKFEYLLKQRYIPVDENDDYHALDGFCMLTRAQSEVLYKCKFHNVDMSRSEAITLFKEGRLAIP